VRLALVRADAGARDDLGQWIGGELAQFVRKAIDDNVKKADKQ